MISRRYLSQKKDHFVRLLHQRRNKRGVHAAAEGHDVALQCPRGVHAPQQGIHCRLGRATAHCVVSAALSDHPPTTTRNYLFVPG